MRFLFYLRYNSTPHVTFFLPGPVVAKRRVCRMAFKRDTRTLGELWRDLASTAGCDQFRQNTKPDQPGSEWHKLLSQVKPELKNISADSVCPLLNSRWKPAAQLSGGLRNDPNNSRNVVVLVEEPWASWSSPEKLVLLFQQKNAPVAEALCDFACLCVWRGGVAQLLRWFSVDLKVEEATVGNLEGSMATPQVV